MLQTFMVKLLPTQEQHVSLLETMHKFNEACDYIAETAFSIRSASKFKLQTKVYYDVRQKFGLSAQLTIRAIAKTCEAYKRDKKTKPTFKPEGAIVYDQRILSWKGLEKVSMVTLKGRIEIPVLLGTYQKEKLNRIRGQADLIYRNNEFYLAVVVNAPEPAKFEVTDVLGVDLGIVNLAVDSDGQIFSGNKVEAVRKRFARLRSILQSVGTKNAKRHLQKLGCQEARFKRDVNHCVSKVIVAKAKDTERGIALEDLSGIRKSVTVRKAQRNRSHSWGFYQLRSFIEYKSALVGVSVFLVNPRGTSHICPKCSHNERANRPSRDLFKCVQCGFSDHSDHVGAVNIRLRALVNKPIAVCCEVKAKIGTVTEHYCKPMTSVMGN